MPTNRDAILLEARDLRHVYHDDGTACPVLHGIDLIVRQGEFVVIAGPSGCGKTTLLHILGLMMQPSSGRLRLAGVDAAALNDAGRTRFRRHLIGFVFQRLNLLPVLTARGNVELALRLRGVSLDGQRAAGFSPRGSPNARSIADRVLVHVGLADKLDKKPRALSIGEQQRVALARAVAVRPQLLLADEPTGSLDSANARIVLDLLRSLHAEYGLTTVMITHDERLTACADRVLHMCDGRLTEPNA
jgi:putative ABC transport system ATP-binding protein